MTPAIGCLDMSCHADDTFPEYDFRLPEELIASRPTPTRRGSRLLVAGRGRAVWSDRSFADLPDLLLPGDLLVVNDSRVLPARLSTKWILEDESGEGGDVEILLVRPLADGAWIVMARPARRLRPGGRLALGGRTLEIVEKMDAGFLVLRGLDADLAELAEVHGDMPLPPYIAKRRQQLPPSSYRDLDQERYQTVYAREKGSVAAPTAGLHFDQAMLDELATRDVGLARVSLHVGPGTFRPPTRADFLQRRLHAEAFTCPAETLAAIEKTRRGGGRVVAVGTTALRVLETVERLQLGARPEAEIRFDAGHGEIPPEFTGWARRRGEAWDVQGLTRLFVAPPDRILAADAMITNFHLPQSSLLMLIAAFLDGDDWRDLYAHAISAAYRFYSYGDAMLILPVSGDGHED